MKLKNAIITLAAVGLIACTPVERKDVTYHDMTAQVRGRVVDTKGKILVSTKVTIVASDDLYIQTRTDENGYFEFGALFPETQYEINVEKEGYIPLQLMMIALDDGEKIEVVLRRPHDYQSR